MPITANEGEYTPRVGLADLYIAEVTQDDAADYVADVPELLAPAAEASQEPETSQDTDYYDDQPKYVLTAEGPTKITLMVSNLPPAMRAKITGSEFDAVSGRVFDDGATPPDIALSFRALKSNGSYVYYQFLKGKFSMPKEDGKTVAGKKEPQRLQLIYTAVATTHKFTRGGRITSVKRVLGDEDTTNFSGATWFNAVQVPSIAAPAALSLTVSDPADGAPGVAVGKTITLTFNNNMPASVIYDVVLVKADGTVVASAISLDATSKIVTIDPTGNLDGGSTYIVTYAVTDIYGQTLAGAINFATA